MATRLAPARPARAPRPDAAPAPGERPHLQVVPARYVSARARRKRARRLVVLTGAGIAAALFGVVAFHVVLTQNQLDIQHLRSEVDAASVKQQQLRLQAAQLESPERVVDAAQKLGMVPPATVRYLSPDGAPTTKPTPTTVPARPAAAKTYTAKATAAKVPVTTAPAKTAVSKTTTKAATASPSPTTTPPAQHR